MNGIVIDMNTSAESLYLDGHAGCQNRRSAA
jgi:hypothetical protein